jgi:hypothetical protein
MALPWTRWFEETLAHRYEPGSALVELDETFRFDQGLALESLRSTGAQVAAVIGLLVMLFGVFAAGGWLQVFLERTSGHSLRRFFWGGARYFWRFARVWILTLISLALATWFLFGWPWQRLVLGGLFGAEGGGAEALDSELTAARVEWFQSGLYVALFALILTWADYTRTRLALHGTRSALWAGLMTWFLILRNPMRTLRPMLLIVALEALVLLGLGALSWDANTGLAPEAKPTAILVLFLVGQLALMWRVISRGARYSAAIQVSRALVAPLPKPDPWARRIGGPGGPQYPIDDSGDGYGVSI